MLKWKWDFIPMLPSTIGATTTMEGGPHLSGASPNILQGCPMVNSTKLTQVWTTCKKTQNRAIPSIGLRWFDPRVVRGFPWICGPTLE